MLSGLTAETLKKVYDHIESGEPHSDCSMEDLRIEIRTMKAYMKIILATLVTEGGGRV